MFLTSLLVSTAFAGTPATLEGLAWEVDDLSRRVQGVLVVGVEDPDAARLIKRLDHEVTDHRVLYVPIRPSSVDPSAGRWTVEHILRVRAESCGLLVQGTSGMAWTTSRVGDCTFEQPALAITPAPAVTPVTVVAAAPLVEVYEPGAAEREPDVAYVRAYQRGALSRGLDYGGPWGVYDGWGEPLTAREFAEKTNDDFTTHRLRRERVAGYLVGAGLVAAGSAAVLGSGLFDYAGADELALGAFEMENAGFHDRRNRAVTGAGVAAIGLVVPLGVHARQRSPYNYYTGLEADAHIHRYNDELRQYWSLSPEDIQDLDPLNTSR
jgi:hypothetical protein